MPESLESTSVGGRKSRAEDPCHCEIQQNLEQSHKAVEEWEKVPLQSLPGEFLVVAAQPNSYVATVLRTVSPAFEKMLFDSLESMCIGMVITVPL